MRVSFSGSLGGVWCLFRKGEEAALFGFSCGVLVLGESEEEDDVVLSPLRLGRSLSAVVGGGSATLGGREEASGWWREGFPDPEERGGLFFGEEGAASFLLEFFLSFGEWGIELAWTTGGAFSSGGGGAKGVGEGKRVVFNICIPAW